MNTRARDVAGLAGAAGRTIPDVIAPGLGITNIAPRATARAAELSRAELRDGARALAAKAAALGPDWVAVVGVSAYRPTWPARPGRGAARPGPRLCSPRAG